MVNKYPIDFDALQYGDAFTETDITRIYQVQPGTPDFAFKLMHLKQEIEQRTNFTARITKNALLVLTPEQASEYNDKEHRRGLNYMRRRFVKLGQVDVTNMITEDREAHQRRVLAASHIQQAIKEGRRRVIGEQKEQKALAQ